MKPERPLFMEVFIFLSSEPSFLAYSQIQEEDERLVDFNSERRICAWRVI